MRVISFAYAFLLVALASVAAAATTPTTAVTLCPTAFQPWTDMIGNLTTQLQPISNTVTVAAKAGTLDFSTVISVAEQAVAAVLSFAKQVVALAGFTTFVQACGQLILAVIPILLAPFIAVVPAVGTLFSVFGV
ncbi:hypothetical protein OG21DRAFT_380030 [Imleria badia]|nr:hypothetical protein OG21DRAFT_380030 [Imleria badia]